MEMKRTRPQARTLSAPQYSLATSTWQGHTEATPEDEKDEKKDTKPYHTRPCPCGRKGHSVAVCYTLNKAMRPAGWDVNMGMQKKAAAELKKDPEWKKWVDEKIAVYNSKKREQDITDEPPKRNAKDSGESSAVALSSHMMVVLWMHHLESNLLDSQ